MGTDGKQGKIQTLQKSAGRRWQRSRGLTTEQAGFFFPRWYRSIANPRYSEIRRCGHLIGQSKMSKFIGNKPNKTYGVVFSKGLKLKFQTTNLGVILRGQLLWRWHGRTHVALKEFLLRISQVRATLIRGTCLTSGRRLGILEKFLLWGLEINHLTGLRLGGRDIIALTLGILLCLTCTIFDRLAVLSTPITQSTHVNLLLHVTVSVLAVLCRLLGIGLVGLY